MLECACVIREVLIVRNVLSDLRLAREFFTLHLPKHILNAIDLATIELLPTVYVDEKLQEYRSDLLYRVKFPESADYLYIIVEHQSKPEKWMPIRINKYVALIVDRYLHKKMPAV